MSTLPYRGVWPEPEEKKEEDGYGSSFRTKETSPYSLYKYRL